METNSDHIKRDHIELMDRLILILDNYKRYTKSHIKEWDTNKCRELEIVNKEMDDLIDTIFLIVAD